MTTEDRDALEAARLPAVTAAVRDALEGIGMAAALAIENGDSTADALARGEEAVRRALALALSGPYADAASGAYDHADRL